MAEVKFQGTAIAKNEDRHVVYGWFSVAADPHGKPVVDRHGDVIDVYDLESAGAEFLKEYRQGGIEHQGGAPNKLVASIVFTPTVQQALGVQLQQGWFGGFEVSADVFTRLAKGELPMFSIEGEAETEIVEVPE